MAWERGFVVCETRIADSTASLLEARSNNVRLVSRGGETAFAFAAREAPKLDPDYCFVCSVDGRNSGYSHSSLKAYRPSYLRPKLGLTFGINLGQSVSGLRSESLEIVVPWQELGPESECEFADTMSAFRWDLEDCEIDDPKLLSCAKALRASHRWLEERSIPHLVVLFDDGWPETFGDFPGSTPILRTLSLRPILGQRSVHVQAQTL